jgi:hypothetical protein
VVCWGNWCDLVMNRLRDSVRYIQKEKDVIAVFGWKIYAPFGYGLGYGVMDL